MIVHVCTHEGGQWHEMSQELYNLFVSEGHYYPIVRVGSWVHDNIIALNHKDINPIRYWPHE